MRKAVLLLCLVPAVALAQQGPGADPGGTVPTSVTLPTERLQTPTASDLYCAGFVAKKIESHSKYVDGGCPRGVQLRCHAARRLPSSVRRETGKRVSSSHEV